MQFIKPMMFALALATSSGVVMLPASAQADLVLTPFSNYALGADFVSSARAGLEGAEIRSLHFLSPLLRTRIVGGGTYVAEAGDIITFVNDRRIWSHYDLASRLRGMSSGTNVKLGIVNIRTGRTEYVWAKLR